MGVMQELRNGGREGGTEGRRDGGRDGGTEGAEGKPTKWPGLTLSD